MIQKRIWAGIALGLLWLAAGAVVISLPSCATIEGETRAKPAAVQLVVSFATMKFIEETPAPDRSKKASALIAVIDDLEAVASGDPVTLQTLAHMAVERIPADMPPSERMLAMSLVNVLEGELRARIGHGGLESGSLVVVRQVLGWVRSAAAFYVTPA